MEHNQHVDAERLLSALNRWESSTGTDQQPRHIKPRKMSKQSKINFRFFPKEKIMPVSTKSNSRSNPSFVFQKHIGIELAQPWADYRSKFQKTHF